MCGIAGIVNFKRNLIAYKGYNTLLVRDMAESLRRRGPDSTGEWVGEHAAFANTRLSVIDPLGGSQPMKRIIEGYEFVITYNGELYNAPELRKDLSEFGYIFSTDSDTETLLYAYVHYGTECAKRLNGMYAFCIWDSMRQRVFACRDRFGIKPFFYTVRDHTFIFASEAKALFRHPAVAPEIDKEGLQELFACPPCHSRGGIFRGIEELPGAHYMLISRTGILTKSYWTLQRTEHTESLEETAGHLRALLCDSVRRRLRADVPIAALLSDGPAFGIAAAIAADALRTRGELLPVYTPDCDMPRLPGTSHILLQQNDPAPIQTLRDAAYHADLPYPTGCGAALLYFCREIKKRHTVVLSDGCADVLFGNAPAFDTDAYYQALSICSGILLPAVAETLDLANYAHAQFEAARAKAPCRSDDPAEQRRLETAYLTLQGHMATLFAHMDRMGMASGVELRFPFCDYRLVEYVWNIPQDMKCGAAILQEAARDILPPSRPAVQQHPRPDNCRLQYETAAKQALLDILEDARAPLLAFVDKQALRNLLADNTAPQHAAYLFQINHWLELYRPMLR